MNIERIKKLEKFLEKDPDDPFLLYALALEWLKDDPQKSRKYFDRLLSEHEDYVGTYYHAASLYTIMGRKNDAEKIYRKGIEIAQRSGDSHALNELQSAYNEFLFEDD